MDIPTLDGTVSLKVPPGTGGGARLRLAGRGIRPAGGSAGDLYAVVRIAAVKDPSRRQRQLLEELAEVLRTRYEIAEVRWHRKPSASRPADPTALKELAEHCDAVIIAVGD